MQGVALLRAAASDRLPRPARPAAMIAGWSLVYLSSHACAHWAVGRLVGIRFDRYEVRLGTANPEQCPPGMRPVMRRLPFWCARTVPGSYRAAPSWAKAAMLAAGDTSNTACTVAAAMWMVRRQVPASRPFAAFVLGWSAIKTVATTRNERGDYGRARKALASTHVDHRQ